MLEKLSAKPQRELAHLDKSLNSLKDIFIDYVFKQGLKSCLQLVQRDQK